MHDRSSEFFIIDILISIDRVQRYLKKFKTPDLFVASEEFYDAAVRELEIIGEAMKYVLADKNFSELTQAKWRKVVDFRNILAHEYFGLDPDLIIYILYEHFPLFETEILHFVEQVKDKEIFFEAIYEAKKDLKVLHRKESLLYLTK